VRSLLLCARSQPIDTYRCGPTGIGAFYGSTDQEGVFNMLSFAADNGITFWDTADTYGTSQYIIHAYFFLACLATYM